MATNKVLAVVVLFNKKFEDVPIASQLIEWLQLTVESNRLNLDYCLIYDNSLTAQSSDLLCNNHCIEIIHDPSNGGTRAAYMKAVERANEKGCEWILLLDHDTLVDERFLLETEDSVFANSQNENISVILPTIFDGGIQVSPSIITNYGRTFPFSNDNKIKLSNAQLTAIASGSLIKTKSFLRLLPIPEVFKLDYLDHWLFRQIQLHGEVLTFSTARINHSLSVLSLSTLSPSRYGKILDAEIAFLQSSSEYSKMLHLLWSILRMIKLILFRQRLILIWLTICSIKNIFYSKYNHDD
jgi:GT2 family glycosyltransferase